MTQDPLVTFVVPCYKLGHLLSQCVSSILRQDYENFEVLIMDNCSPDNTPEVAQSFNDPRVQHIRNESNLGHIRNYNKGLSLARGKYVWLLSADDMLRSPQILSRYVGAMEQNPSAGCVFCRAVELYESKEKGIVSWADRGGEDGIFDGQSFLGELVKNNFIVAPTVMMRKECLEKVGLFQKDLPYASDWYMWCMLAMHFNVVYLAEPMVCYRTHEGSLTTQYSEDYARKCVGDELSVLWRVGREVELANIPSLRVACGAAFADRVFHLLLAPLQAETPSMNVAEFEEILQSRISDADGIREVRAAIYARLTESVAALLHRECPPITFGEQLSLLWGMRCQAKKAGVVSLGTTCEEVFFLWALRLLTASLGGPGPSMSVTEFEEILRGRIQDPSDATHIRTYVYTTIADRQYSNGDLARAKQFYWLALRASPRHLKTWMKHLLLHTGAVGIRLRHLAN